MLLGLPLASRAFLYNCEQMYIRPLKKFYESTCKPYVDCLTDFFDMKIKPVCKAYTMTMIIWMCLFYKMVLQTLRGTLKSIGRNKHEVCYYIGMRRYKLHLNTRSLPSTVIQITDENEDNVTEDVMEYMGPRHDFHNIKYSPSDLGYQSLDFYMIDGETKTFSEKETINLNRD
jgi:hypothetical protein